MRAVLLFALSIMVCAGCQDRPFRAGLPTAPRLEKQGMSDDATRARSDFDFQAAEEAWMRRSPEERREIRALTESAGAVDAPGAVAIVSSELPGGALALVVRDPGLASPRVVVVSDRNLRDAALLLGSAAAGTDESRLPTVQGARVLRVYEDGRVLNSDGTEAFRLETGFLPSGDAHPHITRLERMAQFAFEVNLPGIGQARLLQF